MSHQNRIYGLLSRARRAAPHDFVTLNHLVLNTTTRCQQRCVYCFEGDREGRRDIEGEVVRRMLREAVGQCQGVVFMGAEPTMNPEIVSHIAYARELGLVTLVSTNALRFKSRRFLEECTAAGMSACEISFPYPDSEVYSQITSLKGTGYTSLLTALDHLNELGADGAFTLNVNIVCSRFNHDRLREIFDTLAERLRDTVFVTTLKMINPYAKTPEHLERFRAEHFVPLQVARRSFEALLRDWPYDFPLIFRGYPLCTLPENEELAANFLYHDGGVDSGVVVGNIDDQNALRRLHAWEVTMPERDVPEACQDCSLATLCMDRLMLTYDPADPENRPLPSTRDPRELLASLDFSPEVIDALLTTPVRYEAGHEEAEVEAPPPPEPAPPAPPPESALPPPPPGPARPPTPPEVVAALAWRLLQPPEAGAVTVTEREEDLELAWESADHRVAFDLKQRPATDTDEAFHCGLLRPPPKELAAQERDLLRILASGLGPARQQGVAQLVEVDPGSLSTSTALQRRVEDAVLAASRVAGDGHHPLVSWPARTSDEVVRVSLLLAGEWIDLACEDARKKERCFLEAGEVAVSYFQNTPLDSKPKLQAVRWFGEYLSRV